MASHTSAALISSVVTLVRVPVPVPNFRRVFTSMVADMYHGGTGTITATVRDKGTPDTPVARRVRLHRKIDGMLVRETWSAADGTYTFYSMAAQLYYVVSHDHTGNFNAVIKDNILPVLP